MMGMPKTSHVRAVRQLPLTRLDRTHPGCHTFQQDSGCPSFWVHHLLRLSHACLGHLLGYSMIMVTRVMAKRQRSSKPRPLP